MQTARTLTELRTLVNGWRAAGLHVALVPTMGALHSGHMRLVDEARRHADRVVVSIFVNPRQFGANEDLGRYPRQEDADAALLADAECDLLWLPDVETMYPNGYATNVSVAGVSEGLCGAARPGHFDGVSTVVLKLFNQVAPHSAYFGEKDFQQLAVIKRMVQDLNVDLNVVGVPIVRDADGLALSSRNAYLTADERKRAVALPQAMDFACHSLEAGQAVVDTLEAVRVKLVDAGFEAPDYIALCDAETLQPLDKLVVNVPARLLIAARLGSTRLIDNQAVMLS